MDGWVSLALACAGPSAIVLAIGLMVFWIDRWIQRARVRAVERARAAQIIAGDHWSGLADDGGTRL